MSWMTRELGSAGTRYLNMQVGLGTHPVLYVMGTEGFFPGGKDTRA